MESYSATILYPSQTVFTCPVCSSNYSIFSSWTRHLKSHTTARVDCKFKCSTCDKEYDSRRAVSSHHGKSHGAAQISRMSNSGEYHCEFCHQYYPSIKSRSQHIRNQHAAKARKQRASQASQQPSRQWSTQEHNMFLDALKKHGPSSNVVLAKAIGSKTAKQVSMHKRIFFRDHPGWLEVMEKIPEVEVEDDNNGTVEDTDNNDTEMTPEHTPVVNLSPKAVSSVAPLSITLEAAATDKSPPCSQPSTDGTTPDPESILSVSDYSYNLTQPSSSLNPDPVLENSLITRANDMLTILRKDQLSTTDDPLIIDEGDQMSTTESPVRSSNTSHQFDPNALTTIDEDLATNHGSTTGSSTRPPANNHQLDANAPPFLPTSTPTDDSVLPTDREPLHSNSNSTGVPAPLSDNVSPGQGTNEPSQTSANDRQSSELEEQLGRKNAKLLQALPRYKDRQLEDAEWGSFESLVDEWTSDLKLLMQKAKRRPAGHHTTRWKQRQKRRKNNHSPKSSSNKSHQNSAETHSVLLNDNEPDHNDTPSSSHNDTTHASNDSQEHVHARRHRKNVHRTRAREASKVQKWYKANRKKCVKSITTTSPQNFCEIPTSDLESYHCQAPSEDSPPPPDWLPTGNQLPVDDVSDLLLPFKVEEIQHQVKRLPSDSSPGPDGLDYKSWKLMSGSAQVLCTIYNICRENRRIPNSWKTSNTILIYKKGDPHSPANWRPISLQNTIYKIYAATVAKRLASWCIMTGSISQMQKGFLPFEGCFEHAFLM